MGLQEIHDYSAERDLSSRLTLCALTMQRERESVIYPCVILSNITVYLS